jgi:hypothetical protein
MKGYGSALLYLEEGMCCAGLGQEAEGRGRTAEREGLGRCWGKIDVRGECGVHLMNMAQRTLWKHCTLRTKLYTWRSANGSIYGVWMNRIF